MLDFKAARPYTFGRSFHINRFNPPSSPMPDYGEFNKYQ